MDFAILSIVRQYHEKPMDQNHAEIINKAAREGVLLRTKLRTLIEMLDQIYQYGTLADIETKSVDQEEYIESEV